MKSVDDLWFLGDVACQQAEQTYHDLGERHDGYLEFSTRRNVSRRRYRTVAERTRENGLPYGVHTIAYRPTGELLLVRHDDVDMWVLPGGEVDEGEDFREAARRELREEAGIDATFDGLGMLGRVDFACDGNRTWGVLPIYEARADSTDLTVDDPDEEIVDAAWFDGLPEDTRDREELRRWRRERLES